MYFEQISTPGLGCFSYAIGCPAEGIMAVVDPRRDIGIYLQIAEENEMQITHIFDTHIHADHISGAPELRSSTNADVFIHESASVGYEAKKIKSGDEFRLGSALIRVLHTPGHTPNSVSFLITDMSRSPEPQMILTGDLLFVGDIGRPDLPGEEILNEQVENLFNSLYNTLKPLPDYLEVYPAHGQGSLCGKGMSAKPSSTLGYERIANPMFGYFDFNEFKNVVLSDLPVRPLSFSAIIDANINGAALQPMRDFAEYAISADKADELIKSGAVLLDLRDAASYSAAHIPGSVNIDFSSGAILNWVGIVIPPDAELVLIIPPDNCFEEVYTELRRIGYDTVGGWLAGGFDAWKNSGREVQSLPHLSVSSLRERLAKGDPPAVIDVRTRDEFMGMSIDGSINLPLNRIHDAAALPVDMDHETVVVCQSGFRASIAASILQSRGYTNISLLDGGMNEWEN